jgi:AcrR family transcriptional regulator
VYVNALRNPDAERYSLRVTSDTRRPSEPAEPRRRLTREEARQRTRENLLAAAAVVFDRAGYNGTSLEAVAEAAGYTRGAVYSNFATKADLFMALLERFVEQEGEVQGAQLETQTIEQFFDGLDATFEKQTQDRQWVLLQLEFFLAAARDPAIRAKYLEKSAGLTDLSGQTLDAKLAEMGLDAPFTGRELGILLNALGTGLALDFYLEPEAFDPTLLVRAARLMAGLDPRPRGGGAGGK